MPPTNGCTKVARSRWVAPNLDRLVQRAAEGAGKRFRARMVILAAQLSSKLQKTPVDVELAELFAETIESIHLGSLVVDDIQDGSLSRRGKSSLHCEFGVPLALNAGNWIYFSSLQKLHSLRRDAATERRAMSLTLAAMLEAHEGQSIDLGVDISSVDPCDIATVVALTAEKKTGALMEAAFGLGSIAIRSGSDSVFDAFRKFGRSWGVALQTLDDLGSFQKSLNGVVQDEKQFEDFRNRRPNFIWSLAAELLSVEDKAVFRKFAQQCEDVDQLRTSDLWFDFKIVIERSKILEIGFARVQTAVDDSLGRLCEATAICECRPDSELYSESAQIEIQQLKNISRDLEAAYGNFERISQTTNNVDRFEVVVDRRN